MVKKAPKSSATRRLEQKNRYLTNWVNVRNLHGDTAKMQLLLRDEVTGLSTLSYVISDMETTLANRSQIGLIYIELEKTEKLINDIGLPVFKELLHNVAGYLQTFKGNVIRTDDTIKAVLRNSNEYAVILSPPRKTQTFSYENLLIIRNRLLRNLREKLRSTIDAHIYRKLHLRAGAALITALSGYPAELLLAEALEIARSQSVERKLKTIEAELAMVNASSDKGAINLAFQPVVDITTNLPIGYEALSCSPKGSRQPHCLFKIAVESDLACRLEKRYWEQAFSQAKDMPPGKLFISLNPWAVDNPAFKDILKQLEKGVYGVAKKDVVFGLSENYMTYDPASFHQALSVLHDNGFNMCLDDAGSGYYMGLELIAHTRPEFVKINGQIISGIDQNWPKEELAATIKTFAENAGSTVIAEAVETPAELAILKKLGIRYAQGYLFAKPAAGYPKVNKLQLD